MKIVVANAIREHYINAILSLFNEEDTGMIASNSFNFPIVWEGEEGCVEIVVKVPKYDGDEIYALREEYALKCAEREARKKQKLRRKKSSVTRLSVKHAKPPKKRKRVNNPFLFDSLDVVRLNFFLT